MTRAVTTSPGAAPAGSVAASKATWTRRLSRARPESRWVAPSLRPSPSATSTSRSRPTWRLVLRPRDVVLQGDQPLVALLHDLLGHLAVQVGGRGARALGVLEGEGAREARLATTSRVCCEVVVGLAGEADDDVGGDGGVGHRGADPSMMPR